MLKIINHNSKLKNIYNEIKSFIHFVILSLTGDPVLNKKSNLNKELTKIWIPSQAEDDNVADIRPCFGLCNFKLVFIKVFICLLFLNNITQASIYSDYKVRKAFSKNEFKEAVQILEKEQVETPHEPILNYNLGTAYYKLNNFDKAKSNLKRSVDNCSVIADKKIQGNIKEKAYFNWGNSLYKSGLKLLGKNWEKEKIHNETLDLAITEIKSSIEKYRNVLVLNKDNQWADSNKNNAEELLKKLEEKKQQNKDQQDKKENSDNKDSKSDSGDKKDSSQEQDKNSQSQNTEQQNKREDGSENSKENGDKGEDKEFDNKQAGQEKQDRDKKEQDSSSEQKSEQEQNQSTKKDSNQGSENQETDSENKKSTSGQQVENKEKNDIKSKMLRSVLDNLQYNESELQKALIKRKSIGERPRLDQGQKPW